MTEKAWMIRNDNVVIPINLVHPYGEPGFVIIADENTEVASFLFRHGKNKDAVKHYFVVYFAYYIDKAGFDIQNFDHDRFIADLISSKKNARIIFDNDNTTISVNEKLKKFWDLFENDVIEYLKTGFKKEDIKYINQAINYELNQTFLRARFGGLYNSRADNKGIYFRISSGGFDWNNAVYSFLEKYQRKLGIKTVTVVRDKESTGSGAIYKTNKSIAIEHMPIDSFLNESEGKIPELENFNTKEEDLYRRGPRMIIKDFLRQGKSLNDFKIITEVIGIDELFQQYYDICWAENLLPAFSKELHGCNVRST